MVVRGPVTGLLRRLRSGDEETIRKAILAAWLLFEQSQAAGKETGPDRTESDDFLERLREYQRAGILSSAHIGLVLSAEEEAVIIGALVELLDRGSPAAMSAAAPLAAARSAHAVLKLAEVTRRYAQEDTPYSRNAIYALGRTMEALSLEADGAPGHAALRAVVLEAIRYAAAEGADGVLRAREQAERELEWLSEDSGG